MNIDMKLEARAELHLCLAQTFLPPSSEQVFVALREQLPDDLRELNALLSVLDASALEGLCADFSSLSDQTRLLVTYSRLFLSPPAPALLNLGFYIDGGLQGGSCQAIEALYRAHGLARNPAFRDGPDHLALYLQFVAWMMARAAEHLGAQDEAAANRVLADLHQSIVQHALPAITRLQTQIVKAELEYALPKLYGALCQLVYCALRADALMLQQQLPQPASVSAAVVEAPSLVLVSTDAEHTECAECGKPYVPEAGLAGMIAVLQKQGLATEHMRICPDCRTGAMGLTPMKPPQYRKAG